MKSDGFGQPAETSPPQRPLLLLLLTTGWCLAAANVAAKLPSDPAVLTAVLALAQAPYQEGEDGRHRTDRRGGGATDSRSPSEMALVSRQIGAGLTGLQPLTPEPSAFTGGFLRTNRGGSARLGSA